MFEGASDVLLQAETVDGSYLDDNSIKNLRDAKLVKSSTIDDFIAGLEAPDAGTIHFMGQGRRSARGADIGAD